MTTPTWQPGTLYAPGALVQPLSAIAAIPDQVTNPGFESGNTGWTLASGFSIGEFGNQTHFQGTWSLQWDLTGTGRAINNNATAVVPGQTINGNCQVQQGASSAGQAGARAEIAWYDASDTLISFSQGTLINSGSNAKWKQSSVTGVAPANAAFARFSVWAFRNSGGDELWIDNCSWDAMITELPSGLVFRAVQAVAGYSGSNEPVWPVVNGQTVVDNEVTWEAVFASRIVWEASPILVSGPYEPDFPEAQDGTVADGTIKWVAMNHRVTDSKCPQSEIITMGASKIFAADDDIIPFCATNNPLDWSSEQDAGFLPFGLQTFGGNPVTAMNLYRGNLVAFNVEGYQMWQIDEDPANMAILDASPVGCTHNASAMPVSDDLVFLSPLGVRNIGIAGASTNIQAGYFGKQIDPLVMAKVKAGLIPNALFYPGAGQYWIFFGAEAFVLTMNGGPKDQSWSRYVFPAAIEYWTLLGDDLYLAATVDSQRVVWRVSDEALEDDIREVSTSVLCDVDAWHSAAVDDTPPAAFVDDHWEFTTALTHYQREIYAAGLMPDEITFHWEITEEPDPGDTLYIAYGDEGDIFPFSNRHELVGTSGSFTIPTESGFNWGVTTTAEGSLMEMDSGAVTISCDTEQVGTPFEGEVWWPYLDFGALGVDKQLESLDLAITGEVSVSFGYDQKRTNLATPGYTVDGDTLNGTPIPFPLTAPSFQLRLTFSGSQSWEWQAAALHTVD